ncbi:hypothetical protein NFI96_008943, partial [Prochilodus magdalenae]
EFSLVVPDGVVGQLGSSVVLPCAVSPSQNCKSFEIHWHGPNNKDNLILLYKDLKVQENTGDPRYRNRVSLVGELGKGNVSLKLENLTLADRGEYVCFVESYKWFEKANVFLNLTVVGSPPLLSIAEAGEQVNVTCASGGWSPNPTLIWRDKEGRELRNSVDHYRAGRIFPKHSQKKSASTAGTETPNQGTPKDPGTPAGTEPANEGTPKDPGTPAGTETTNEGTTKDPGTPAGTKTADEGTPKYPGPPGPANGNKDTTTNPGTPAGTETANGGTPKDPGTPVAITVQSSDSTLGCWFKERIHSGQFYWEVTGLTNNTGIFKNTYKCPTSWYVGVTNQSAERRPVPLTPQNGYWVLQYDRDKGYYVNDPSLTPVLVRDEFSLVVPDGVVGQLGSSVVLPCAVSPSQNCKSFEVHWYGPNNKDKLILLYKDLKVQEDTGDPRYRNRVSLIGELGKGNVSLKLENLTLADRGEYVCYVESYKWYERASVFLNLPVLGSLPVLSVAEAGQQVNVTCASGGWSPNPTLIWRDKEGRELRNSVDHYRADSEGLVSVSSWLLVSPSESEWIYCSVGLSGQEMKEGKVLPLKPDSGNDLLEPRVSPRWTAVIISVVIGLLLLAIMAVFIFRTRGPLEEEGRPLVAVTETTNEGTPKDPGTPGGTETANEGTPNDPGTPAGTETTNEGTPKDPGTPASPESSTESEAEHPVAIKPDSTGLTLGCWFRERIHSGQYYWEVTGLTDVSLNTEAFKKIYKCPSSWSVGVTNQSAERRRPFPVTPQNGYWVLQYDRDKGYYVNDLSLTPVLVRGIDKMLLWLMFNLLSCSNAEEFSLVVPDGVAGWLGSSVVLPCAVSPSQNSKSFEVYWYGPNNKDNLILLYKDLKVQEDTGDPRYRNRVSLIGDLEKGNVSLKLGNFTLADRGEYVCYVESYKWYEKASVFLNLLALSCEILKSVLLNHLVVGSIPVLSVAETGEQVNVTCASGGWSPNTSVTWRDKDGRELADSVDHYRTDSEGLVSVSSWLLVSPSESEWISCSVGLSDQEMKEGRVLPLKPAYKADLGIDSYSTSEPESKVVITLLVISLLMLVVMAVFIFKNRDRIFPKRSQKESPSTEELSPPSSPVCALRKRNRTDGATQTSGEVSPPSGPDSAQKGIHRNYGDIQTSEGFSPPSRSDSTLWEIHRNDGTIQTSVKLMELFSPSAGPATDRKDRHTAGPATGNKETSPARKTPEELSPPSRSYSTLWKTDRTDGTIQTSYKGREFHSFRTTQEKSRPPPVVPLNQEELSPPSGSYSPLWKTHRIDGTIQTSVFLRFQSSDSTLGCWFREENSLRTVFNWEVDRTDKTYPTTNTGTVKRMYKCPTSWYVGCGSKPTNQQRGGHQIL